MADALDGARNDSELARLVARELNNRAAPCRPLAKRLGQLKYQSEDFRLAFLIRSLEQGLNECQCQRVDIDALEYLVMRLLEVPANDIGAVQLPNDESGRPIVPTDLDLTVGEWVQRL